MYRGVFTWTFRPEHDPKRRNYPHTEVRAYENERHISAEEHAQVEPEIYMKWREQLLWTLRRFVAPGEEVDVRQTAP
jgi:hypothetical protein